MLRWGRIEASGGFLLLTATLYYLDGDGVVAWALLACALHELGHYAAVRLLGGRVEFLRLTCVGAEMRLELPAYFIINISWKERKFPFRFPGPLAKIDNPT